MKKRILIYAAIFLVFLFVTLFVYRFVFEFKNSRVKELIQAEANQYSDPTTVYGIIHECAKHILQSASLTSTVRKTAKATGIEKEKVLVDMAIAQGQALKLLKA